MSDHRQRMTYAPSKGRTDAPRRRPNHLPKVPKATPKVGLPREIPIESNGRMTAFISPNGTRSVRPSGRIPMDIPTINLTRKQRVILVWHQEKPPGDVFEIRWLDLFARCYWQYTQKTVGTLPPDEAADGGIFDFCKLVRAQMWGQRDNDAMGFELSKVYTERAEPSGTYFDTSTGDSDRPTAVIHGGPEDYGGKVVTPIIRCIGGTVLHITADFWSGATS